MANEEELEEGKMPLLDHLIELRRRLLYSILAWLVMFAPCWYFSKDIYNFLAQPLAQILSEQTGGHFIYTDLTEAFFTDLRVAFWASFCLAFPVIASQIWMFVAPGPYRNERRASCPTCSRRRSSSSSARRSPISSSSPSPSASSRASRRWAAMARSPSSFSPR
jgi:sec-independent protein translocase protein TatC